MRKRVGLIGDNSKEYVEILVGIWARGDCAVLIDWRIPVNTAIGMLIEAGVEECYIESEFIDKYPVNFFDIIEFKKNKNKVIDKDIEYKANYSYEEAIILYSSGTTGKSKGVILTHFAISTNADAIIEYLNMQDNECIYIVKSFSHASTLVGELVVALKTKIKIVIASTVALPNRVLLDIDKYKVTMMGVNPTLLQLYGEQYEKGDIELKSLKRIYVSGSILHLKTYNQAVERFKDINIYNVYGLSEMGPRVTAQTKYYHSKNSVGIPIKGVEVMILNDDGLEVEYGEIGIIHIKSHTKFKGYVIGEIKHRPLKSDYFNSGDLGYRNEKEEIFIVGRADDVIIQGSYNIYPNDIENLVLEIDVVNECCVVGVEDRLLDQKIVCFYTSRDSNDISLEIRKYLNNRISINEMPKKFVQIDKMPKNANGKIDKMQLKNYRNYQ